MNALDRIKKAHVAIMRHPKACVYAGVLAYGRTEIDDTRPTAWTNGQDKFYNTKFVDSLSDPELRFLVLHEATHVAYRHLHTWASLHSQNAQLANIACDHFVNLSLQDMDAGEGFIKMPAVGIQPDPKYRGWSVKQIYDDLVRNPPPDDEQDGGSGLDDHKWGDDGAGAGAGDEATEAKRANEIAQAVRQGEMLRRKLAGKGAGGMDGVFGDLLAPKIDWRKALREFISELCRGHDESSWARVNRRFIGDGIYMPGWMSTTMTELVVAIDTSGSVFHGPEMQRFVTELTTITQQVSPSKVHVLYWDTEVCGHQTFEDGQFAVQDLKPRGGGGTDAACVFDYLRSKRITPQAIVVLTDGFVSSWGKADAPTLWAITTDRKAPWGTTIHIEG